MVKMNHILYTVLCSLNKIFEHSMMCLTLKKHLVFSLQVKFLSRLGGFGPKDVIKNIMQQVLTDDLAKEFNWQGRGDKKPFSKLILADVIKGKVNEHFTHTESFYLLMFCHSITW